MERGKKEKVIEGVWEAEEKYMKKDSVKERKERDGKI